MIEETAVRVEISAARFASQSIFDILRLTVQAMNSQNYGQQSLDALNRQERPLASVDVNKKTLPYIRRQLKQYSVDFSVTKDRDTGQMYLWFKGTGCGSYSDRVGKLHRRTRQRAPDSRAERPL